MRIFEHEPLAPRTTFNVGGSARFLIEVETEEDVRGALALAHKSGLPVCIIGGGSNVLADDGEAEGVFIAVKTTGCVREGDTVIAGAGEVWDDLVSFAVLEERWGIENLSAIPGTVGGAVVQNAGAYGVEVEDTLAWVEAFDVKTGALKRLSKEACNFSYRTSCFKREVGRYIILRAAFTLSAAGSPNIAYRDLTERFNGSTPTVAQVRDAVRDIRAGKFPDLKGGGTAGSFFKNPVISNTEVGRLVERFPGLPVFAAADGVTSKVSLAWLLDHALNLRGKTEGFVRCYEKQPLVIVAQHGARAEEVRSFAAMIKTRVAKEIGISIEPEVIIMRGMRMTNEC